MFVEHPARAIANPLDRVGLAAQAAIRQHRVRARQVDQPHFAPTEREREPVPLAVCQRSQSHAVRNVEEGIDAENIQRPHGRHVVRRGQGRPQRDNAVEAAVVVARRVEPIRRLERRGHVEQGGRGGVAAFHGGGVEEGLERRTGLTECKGHVHLPADSRVVEAGAPHHRPNRAITRVEHHHGRVRRVVLLHLSETHRHGALGFSLQPGVERGFDHEACLADEVGPNTCDLGERVLDEMRRNRRGINSEKLEILCQRGRLRLARNLAVVAQPREHVGLASTRRSRVRIDVVPGGIPR